MKLPVHSLPRKAYRSDLSDIQWKRIKRLLPKPKRMGRPRSDDREVINGILYVLNTGCRWEDMPHDIAASYSNLPSSFAGLPTASRVAKNLGRLNERSGSQGTPQPQECLSRCERGEDKKGAKSHVGFSGKHRINGLKRHLVIDANGNPLNFTLSKANRNDQINLLETIDGIKIGKRRRRPKR